MQRFMIFIIHLSLFYFTEGLKIDYLNELSHLILKKKSEFIKLLCISGFGGDICANYKILKKR